MLPYLPIESSGCVIGEEPVLSSELGQLNPAEVPTVSSRDRWYRQQSIWELEEVGVTAPEFVPIDLRGIPLEGRDRHIWTRFQDSAPSGKKRKKNIYNTKP